MVFLVVICIGQCNQLNTNDKVIEFFPPVVGVHTERCYGKSEH